ncbi:MAG: patatin-like phospholipase family protein [Kiritimatiellae bacterium]|nr:patatin-like phospholipase family protein [Kiritimatiellia bacterium]
MGESGKPSRVTGDGLGIALGSGGARGLAHVGVLQTLLENGIAPEFVAGTSMGAIVGAAYASGNFGRLVDTLKAMDMAEAASLFFDFGFMKSGLVKGRRVMDFIATVVPDTTFDSIGLPFAVMATDIATGAAIRISRGRLLPAIRASISIPGVFTPVRRGSALLVDGGVSSPVPVAAARFLGARRVLAVNVDNQGRCPYSTHRLPKFVNQAIGIREKLHDALRRELGIADERGQGFFDMLSRTTRICEDRIAQWEMERERPEWILEPAVGDIPTMDFTRVDDAIMAGRDAAGKLLCQT